MELSRPEYWSGFLSPGDLTNPGTEPRSPALQADSLQLSHEGSPRILEWVAYPFSRELIMLSFVPMQHYFSTLVHLNSLLPTAKTLPCPLWESTEWMREDGTVWVPATACSL